MQVSGSGMTDLLGGAASAAGASGTASARAKSPADGDPTSAPAFAAMLTGAMTPQPQPEAAVRPQPAGEPAGQTTDGTPQETATDGRSATGTTALGPTADAVALPNVPAMTGMRDAGLHALRFALRTDVRPMDGAAVAGTPVTSAPVAGAPIVTPTVAPIDATVGEAVHADVGAPAGELLVDGAPAGTVEHAGGTDAADSAAESASSAGAPPRTHVGAGTDAAPTHSVADPAAATQDASARGPVEEQDDEDRGEAESTDAPATAGPVDMSQLTRALDTVPPELRARIERAVERMRAEGGQDAAAEQPSTPARPAAVPARTLGADAAAWTQDGQPSAAPGFEPTVGFDNGAAFEQIQQLASESGAMGVSDLGALALPDGVTIESLSVQPGSPAPTVATVAPASEPAAQPSVVAFAQATSGAQPTTAGAAERDASSAGRATERADASAADAAPSDTSGRAFLQATHAALAARRGGDASASSEGDRRGGQRQPQRTTIGSFSGRRSAGGASAPSAEPAPTPSSALGASVPATGFQAAAAEVAGPAPLAGAVAVDRVAQIIERRDSAPVAPMSSLTLKIDNLAGGVDRIRIGLRGIEVGTSIELGDAAAAERLQGSIGELRSALGRHGLSSDTVTISSAGRAAEQVDASRLTAAAASSSGGAERSGSGPNGGSSQQQAQQQARDPREAMRDAARDSSGQKRNGRDAQSSEDGEPHGGRRPRRDRR